MRSALVGLAVAVLAASNPLITSKAAVPRERTYRSENFALTYSTARKSPDTPSLADTDASGHPDTVERMVAAFEEARARILALGYLPPPVEGRYRLHSAGAVTRGYTQTLEGETRSRGSFVLVPTSLLNEDTALGRMRAFAAHEFFHAIQDGYDFAEDRWIKESSASWIQDVVFDKADSNHYYLSDFVPFPSASLLHTNSEQEYGAFLFLQFLTERYGGGSDAGVSLVRRLWELMAVPEALPGAPDLDSVSAVEELLGEQSTTLEQAWAEFLVWRWRLRNFEEGASYIEALQGSAWPRADTVDRVEEESCRIDAGSQSGHLLFPLSATYARFVPGPSESESAIVNVVGEPGITASIILKSTADVVTAQAAPIGPDGLSRFAVPFDETTKSLVVAIGNGSGRVPVRAAFSLKREGASSVAAGTPFGPSTLIFGEGTLLRGVVLCNDQPAPQTQVILSATDQSTGEVVEVPLMTDAAGTWKYHMQPSRNTTYSVGVEDPLISSATSPLKTVSVLLDVSLEADRGVVDLGQAVSLSGEVRPNHGQLPIALEFRRPEQGWRPGTETTSNGSGHFSAQLTLPGSGIWEIRARPLTTNDEDHEPEASNPVVIDVRD